MEEKIVLFPEIGPRKIEKKRAHLQAKDDQNCAKRLVHERETEKRTALHGVAERLAAIGGFGNFLKFADGLFEQAHLAERDAKVVVGFEIFFFTAHFAKLGAEFIEDFPEWARFGVVLGRRWSGSNWRLRRPNRRRRSRG